MNRMTLQSNEYNEKKRKKNEKFLFSTEAVERFSIKVLSFFLLLLIILAFLYEGENTDTHTHSLQ